MWRLWLLGWRPSLSIATRVEALATRLEASAIRVEAIAIRLEAIAIRLEAIATRVEATSIRLKEALKEFQGGNGCLWRERKCRRTGEKMEEW